MAYNPATDFVGLWRAQAGGVVKVEFPGLDFVAAALGRAGLLNIAAQNAAPGANQNITAWFQPNAISYNAEGVMQLWNGAAYVAASQQLLLEQLANAELTAARTIAIRALLDTLGTTRGSVPYRGAAGWAALVPAAAGTLYTSNGVGADPSWSVLNISGALDVLGAVQGDIIYRSAAGWVVLPPGTAGQLLASGGAAANPLWSSVGSSVSNVLAADVNMVNANTFYTGPTCAQGNQGTWFASGQVMLGGVGGDKFTIKLWDGTTVMASQQIQVATAQFMSYEISGVITNPAGNIRIDVTDQTNNNAIIKANATGLGKDSVLNCIRIA